jgi:transcription antitermination protein NusB
MASRRRIARIAVMQTLFEIDFHEGETEGNPSEILERNVSDIKNEEIDKEFSQELLKGVVEYGEDVRSAMQEHAPQWPLERMDRITRSILMLGTYELMYGNDAPAAVVMNEAIDIAKEFGGEESGKFVNGVLNAIAHN